MASRRPTAAPLFLALLSAATACGGIEAFSGKDGGKKDAGPSPARTAPAKEDALDTDTSGGAGTPTPSPGPGDTGTPGAGATATATARTGATANVTATATATPTIASGAPLFVLVGYGGIRARSVDGKTWLDTQGDGPAGDNNFLYRDVVYANGRFCAVGGGTPTASGGNMMRAATSVDGVTWENTGDTDQWLGGVAWTGQYFVAAGGGGRVVRSTDCKTWTQTRGANFGGNGPGHIRWANFANGVLTIGGDSSTQHSVDHGSTWQAGLGGGAGERDRETATLGTLRVETGWGNVRWFQGGQNGQTNLAKSPVAVTVRP